MIRRSHKTSPWLLASTAALLACSACSGGDDLDAGPGADAGVADGSASDGGTVDSGPRRDGGDVVTGCDNPAIAPAPSGTCSYTAGTNGATLLRGDVLAPEGLLENGHVLVGSDGKIACTGCDCSADPAFAEAAIVACADGVVSSALINMHDHITFTETGPTPPPNPDERYDHRHDWRRGLDNHTRIPSVGNTGGENGVWWGELRNLMAGATAVNGSGGAPGLLRNLDRSGAQQEGLNQGSIYYSTFPLNDTDGSKRLGNCNYDSLDSVEEARFRDAVAYTPHIAEGIEAEARNEFLCLSGVQMGGSDVITDKTAVIHGIGLLPPDWAAMAVDGSSLIWSARTNLSLYGITADVITARASGVNITLGTDWTASGSMNMLRELRCVDEYNTRNLGGYFTDREMFELATVNAATAFRTSDKLGSLAPGREADITIFSKRNADGYRAVLAADPQDVVLVMRGGLPMYGDQSLMDVLPDGMTGCETLDVCGTQKSVCAERETGSTIADLRGRIMSGAYDLFFCEQPPMEPSCIPFRTGEFMGVGSDTDSDGDGVTDDLDNCPSVFNPIRPLDQGIQADFDSDMVGDACDACPLAEGTSGCSPPDPNDLDGDGVPNLQDNCPSLANMDQADRDMDMVGDACDACPDEANPGGSACSQTIYTVKQGMVSSGRVKFNNIIVTGVSSRGFFAQHAPGDDDYDTTLGPDYSGIFTFNNGDSQPAVGDRVTVEGDVADFFGQTQLSNAVTTVLMSDQPLPAPVLVSPADVATAMPRGSRLEAVLVEVRGVTVTELNPPAGAGDSDPTNEFVLDGSLRVNDLFFRLEPFPQVGEPLSFVAGLLRFANDDFKLEPRDPSDVGASASLFGFNPSVTYVAAGVDGVPSRGLQVALTRPALMDVTVTLSSADPGLTVPGSVVVPQGMTSVDVPITAPNPIAGTATITASYDGVTAEGYVVVYDDAQPRRIDAASLSAASLPINGSATVTVRLDLPAAVGGTELTTSLAPSGIASVPASVILPADDFEITFNLTTNTATGAGQLTVMTSTDSIALAFLVNASVTRPPAAAGDLIITEIFRNPSGSNEQEREWFEIHNPTTDTISVDGMVVADNNGSHTIVSPNGVVAPGGYAIIAYFAAEARNGGVMGVVGEYGAANLQLANGNDEIHISYGGTEIDVVDWEAGWPGGGQGVAGCLKFPYAADNNVATAWGNSIGSFGTSGDTGHPGVASDAGNCN